MQVRPSFVQKFFPDVLRVVAEFVILIQPTCLPVSPGHGSDVVDPPKEAEEEEGSCSPVRRRRNVIFVAVVAKCWTLSSQHQLSRRSSCARVRRSSTPVSRRAVRTWDFVFCTLCCRQGIFGSPFVGCVDFSYIYLSCLSGM